ncbi:hypothetical protein Tco_0113141, partial [Tanacetum coccineum]
KLSVEPVEKGIEKNFALKFENGKEFYQMIDTPYPMEVDTPYPMEVDTPYPMEVDTPY